MGSHRTEQGNYDNGIDTAKLRAIAPLGSNAAATATTTAAGVVKKMPNTTDLVGAPTMADFNNLLAKLRTAGLM